MMQRPTTVTGQLAVLARAHAHAVFALAAATVSLGALALRAGVTGSEPVSASRNPLYLGTQLFATAEGFDVFFRSGGRRFYTVAIDRGGRPRTGARLLAETNNGSVAARVGDGYVAGVVWRTTGDDDERSRDIIELIRLRADGSVVERGPTLPGTYANTLLGLHLSPAADGGFTVIFGRRGGYGDLFSQEMDARSRPRSELRRIGPYAQSLLAWVGAPSSQGTSLLAAAGNHPGHPGLMLHPRATLATPPRPERAALDLVDGEPQVLLAATHDGFAAAWTAHNQGQVWFARCDAEGRVRSSKLVVDEPWGRSLDALMGDGRRWVLVMNDNFQRRGGTFTVSLGEDGTPRSPPRTISESPRLLSNFVRVDGLWVAARNFNDLPAKVELVWLDDDGAVVTRAAR